MIEVVYLCASIILLDVNTRFGYIQPSNIAFQRTRNDMEKLKYLTAVIPGECHYLD